MSQQEFVAIVILIFVIGLWLTSAKFRKFLNPFFFSQKRDLRFEDLPEIFSGHKSFRIEHNPSRTMPGAHRSIQARSNQVSIIYHTTRKSVGFAETVDIACPDKVGMILTFNNGKLIVFERIGSQDIPNPALTDAEESSLTFFMTCVRECFKNGDSQTTKTLIDGKSAI